MNNKRLLLLSLLCVPFFYAMCQVTVTSVNNYSMSFGTTGMVWNDTGDTLFLAATQYHQVQWILPTSPSSNILAGSGSPGYQDGSVTSAQFKNPTGVCIGPLGAIYVADSGNHCIRKIFNGQVTTFAGNGSPGWVDGNGTSAMFYRPTSVAMDTSGFLIVADYGNHCIRRISPTGQVTTISGTPGISGSSDGIGNSASYNGPFGIATNGSGTIYVTDRNNHTIRKLSGPGHESYTLMGLAGTSGDVDGSVAVARLKEPTGITVDKYGRIYFTETGNHKLKKINLNNNCFKVAGTGIGTSIYGDTSVASFSTPLTVGVRDGGDIYVWHNNLELAMVEEVTYKGRVMAGTSPASGVPVVLVHHVPNTAEMYPISFVTTDANGDFMFYNMPAGFDFMLRAMTPGMNNYMATYYPNVIMAKNCTLINAGDSVVIDLVPQGTATSGVGIVHGRVIQGYPDKTAGQGGVIVDLDVFAQDPQTNTPFFHTTTDTNGYFSFPSLPNSNWDCQLVADDWHTDNSLGEVYLFDSISYFYYNIDFILDSTGIHATPGVWRDEIDFDRAGVNVYPNPAETFVKVRLADQAWSSETKVDLFTIEGKKVNVSSRAEEGEIHLDLNDCQSGIYFLKISDVRGRAVFRKMIIQK